MLIVSIDRNRRPILLPRLAVETCYWSLCEVQDGKWTTNYDPKDGKTPITDWLKPQGRFTHLFAPGNEVLLAQFHMLVDDDWECFKKLQKMSKSWPLHWQISWEAAWAAKSLYILPPWLWSHRALGAITRRKIKRKLDTPKEIC